MKENLNNLRRQRNCTPYELYKSASFIDEVENSCNEIIYFLRSIFIQYMVLYTIIQKLSIRNASPKEISTCKVI